MGLGVVGFDWRHVISTILGYCLSSLTHSDQALIHAVQEAGRTAEVRCLEGVKDHLSCPTGPVYQTTFEVKCAFGFTLISVAGGLIIWCWFHCCRQRITTAVVLDRDSDNSPVSADERRKLAHRQLAEIRARARRDGTAQ